MGKGQGNSGGEVTRAVGSLGEVGSLGAVVA